MPIAKKRGRQPRKGSSMSAAARALKKLGVGTSAKKSKMSAQDAKAIRDRLKQERAVGVKRGGK